MVAEYILPEYILNGIHFLLIALGLYFFFGAIGRLLNLSRFVSDFAIAKELQTLRITVQTELLELRKVLEEKAR